MRIRDEKCAKEGYVHRDADAVSYAMELAASCGGGTGGSQCEDKTPNEQEDRDILMYDIREKELVILETTLLDDALSQVLPQFTDGNQRGHHTDGAQYDLAAGDDGRSAGCG